MVDPSSATFIFEQNDLLAVNTISLTPRALAQMMGSIAVLGSRIIDILALLLLLSE